MEKIKVYAFDDNEDRRESLKYLVQMCDDMEWLGSDENAANAVHIVKEKKPDVVLMDIQMPEVDGLKGLAEIKKNFPHVIVLMQTIFEDDEKVFAALRLGASGYILKKSTPEKFVDAIRDAYHGGAPITPSIATKVLSYFNSLNTTTSTNDGYNLTAREKEILALLVDGLSYKMIGEKLSISFFTVNNHIRHIYEKMHVHSQSEAVSKALREKLLSILVVIGMALISH
jgi:DNA-binding NarL/FixJ family response regulator